MKVLVIGDVIIDRYTHGRKLGVSAETPTVVGEFVREDVYVGGAGLVARNLLRLGCEVGLLTVSSEGPDYLMKIMRDQTDPLWSREAEMFIPFVMRGTHWRFTEKRRYFIDEYKMVQYDVLNSSAHSSNSEKLFLEEFMNDLHVLKPQAVVICDNRHGVLSQVIVQKILEKCKEKEIVTYVDSQVSQKKSNHWWYAGADWILANNIEALDLTAASEEPREMANLPKLFGSNFVVKLGAAGAMMFTKDGASEYSQGFKVDVVDTCGAGDAFLAAFVAHKDLNTANCWAALSTTYKGTIVPRIDDLEKVT